MDISEAKASLPSALDHEFAVRLLVVAERRFLKAHHEDNKQQD
jgi:hypothetical protein